MRKEALLWAMPLVVVGLAGCGNMGLLIRPVPAGRELSETIIVNAGPFVSNRIAVIDVDGLLLNHRRSELLSDGENPVDLFAEKLRKAAADKRVKAIVVRINSPGGAVAASDIMYCSLMDFKRRTGKPVVVAMLDVAASGAYYLACAGDCIVAQPTTITGSIGVLMQTFSIQKTLGMIGVKSYTIKSGPAKDTGSPFRDMTEQERKRLQEIVDIFYKQFVDVVAAGRGKLTRDDILKLADGRVFTGRQALRCGLVDSLGYLDDAIAIARRRAGVARAHVVMYHRPLGYRGSIYSRASGPQAANSINIFLPNDLPGAGPQFLYLWQPALR